MISFKELVGRRTLILGDLKAGKTRLTAKFLEELVRLFPGEVAVLDLAPSFVHGVGGKLEIPRGIEIEYLSTSIQAPHFVDRPEGVLEQANRNRDSIEALFEEYSRSPKMVLVINDVSSYLQAGSVERLLSLMEKVETVLMNGYYGPPFPGCPLAEGERERMEDLADFCNRVIHI